MGLFDWFRKKPKTGAGAGSGLVELSSLPGEVLVLPLRDSVLFPGGVLPIAVGKPSPLALVSEAMQSRDDLLMLVTQRSAETVDPTPEQLFNWGTVSRIVKAQAASGGVQSLMVHGLARARATWFPRAQAPMLAKVEYARTENEGFEGVVDATREMRAIALELIARMPELPPEARRLVEAIQGPGHLCDLLIANVNIALELKQRVLETTDLRVRIAFATELLGAKLASTAPVARSRP